MTTLLEIIGAFVKRLRSRSRPACASLAGLGSAPIGA
jgi:hypothetical protein